ncbi:MAG: tetratricopeptide repeat protein [Sporomusaceae bacterium]|nr:tetratricopeptide repeat protein [Sporomusaceae bacterium]
MRFSGFYPGYFAKNRVWRSLSRRGFSYLRKEQYDLALVDLIKVLEIQPNNERVRSDYELVLRLITGQEQLPAKNTNS